jgi:hypothetical protein
MMFDHFVGAVEPPTILMAAQAGCSYHEDDIDNDRDIQVNTCLSRVFVRTI